jgi:hypothetical protein
MTFTSATTTSTSTSTSTPPPPPAVICVVPRVIGLTLRRAKAKIRAKHCSVGRIRRTHSSRVGRVIAQNPRPGKIKPRGFPVKLVVGRRSQRAESRLAGEPSV